MKHSALTRAMSLLGTCFALCASAQAGTFSVTNTSATGTGSLHQAVAATAPSDTIIFAAGLFGQSIQLGETLVINKRLSNPCTDLTLTAPGSATEITPDGKLRFGFPANDNPAFFRIEAR